MASPSAADLMLGEKKPDPELIMAEAPPIKVKVVKERKVREKREK